MVHLFQKWKLHDWYRNDLEGLRNEVFVVFTGIMSKYVKKTKQQLVRHPPKAAIAHLCDADLHCRTLCTSRHRSSSRRGASSSSSATFLMSLSSASGTSTS